MDAEMQSLVDDMLLDAMTAAAAHIHIASLMEADHQRRTPLLLVLSSILQEALQRIKTTSDKLVGEETMESVVNAVLTDAMALATQWEAMEQAQSQPPRPSPLIITGGSRNIH